jgi:malonate-semialdehyde dehydrogenase (acetylating)/methylmalonate-semialdehyde dehydrogenase
MAIKELKNFINGEWVRSKSKNVEQIPNPATGEIIGTVPLSTREEFDEAVKAASEAFKSWRKVPSPNRARIMFKYHELLQKNKEELAKILCMETGKVMVDCYGSVQRGLEIIEIVCAAPTLLMGDAQLEISTDCDGAFYRYPLGVCGGISPFNFPFMVSQWMHPFAIVCGNTYVLKPSERAPIFSELMVNLLTEAGIPKGVLNVVHGANDVVNAMLEHPDVKAVTMVGSSPVAEYVYKHGTTHGKRVQSFGGAKNHGIVLADCEIEKTAIGAANGAFGSQGERCMAVTVICVVQEIADKFVELLVREAKRFKVGDPADKTSVVGPLIRESHRNKVVEYIEKGVEEGAKLVLDGRTIIRDMKKGYYLGPTIFDNVNENMKIWQDEIFAPVLCIVRIKDLEEGIKIANKSRYANGACIYTSSGKAVKVFCENVDGGCIGVNVNVPAPMALLPFAGNKWSQNGDLSMSTIEGVQFYTRKKVVTTRWF